MPNRISKSRHIPYLAVRQYEFATKLGAYFLEHLWRNTHVIPWRMPTVISHIAQ